MVAVSWLQKEDRTKTVIVTVTDLGDFQDWRKVIARKEDCNLCGVILCCVVYSKLASENRRKQYSVVISYQLYNYWNTNFAIIEIPESLRSLTLRGSIWGGDHPV